MSAVLPRSTLPPAAASAPADGALRITLLFTGCVLAATVSLAIAQPQPTITADPELARLLRGMAAIKALILLPVLALLAWRLRSPIAPRLALGYLLGAWAMTGATGLIWQLAHIGTAAALFHAGALALLLLAWRDEMPRTPLARLLRRATRPRADPPPA